METIDTHDPTAAAAAAVRAIHGGDVLALERLLAAHPHLATVRLVGADRDGACGMSRTLLHVAADWPGHFWGLPQGRVVNVLAGHARGVG